MWIWRVVLDGGWISPTVPAFFFFVLQLFFFFFSSIDKWSLQFLSVNLNVLIHRGDLQVCCIHPHDLSIPSFHILHFLCFSSYMQVTTYYALCRLLSIFLTEAVWFMFCVWCLFVHLVSFHVIWKIYSDGFTSCKHRGQIWCPGVKWGWSKK